ncbi:hypothetical protein NP493_801g02066 [Ridgeia piscesae]|uniref:SUMO-activating enzyme subunit 1 n=1 Tax=Ridgeia piscesae TaxID=27915 RepID=A0AAD9KNB8_RIDPI|nr:hypothetical protein NP493_801g02066 [Ridgeia piscesae]
MLVTMVEQDSLTLTEDEAALYDRQIRLWGLDAQKRLRAAKVLLVGIGGLGAEVAKNIVLSGIKSLTILDHQQVTEAARCSQFLIDHTAHLGHNRALSSLERTQLLNPMVSVSADAADVADKPDDFFRSFDVICATCCSEQQLLRINDLCRANGSLFFAGDVFGYYGYMFADLNQHEFAEEVQQKVKAVADAGDGDGEPAAKRSKHSATETVTVKKTMTFTHLKDALTIDWTAEGMAKKAKKTPDTYFITRVLMEFCKVHKRAPRVSSLESDKEALTKLRHSLLTALAVDESLVPQDFVNFCFAELSPVCAVVGGVLGQEIIKAVSQRDAPHNNFFFYNGVNGSGMVDLLC